MFTLLFAAKTAQSSRYGLHTGSVFSKDPISPLSWEVGRQWIRLVCPAHPTDACVGWDLGYLENTPDLLLWSSNSSWTICASWQDALSCRWQSQPSGNTVSQQTNTQYHLLFTFYQNQDYLLQQSELQQQSQLWFGPQEPAFTPYVYQWALATHDPVFGSFCCFLWALLINTDHSTPGTPHKSCSFSDALTQWSSLTV